MSESHQKIAKILRTDVKVLFDLETKMESLTGVRGVIEKISNENDILVKRTLEEIGLDSRATAEQIYSSLLDRHIFIDGQLYEMLGRPNLFEREGAKTLIEMARETVNRNHGFFLKLEMAKEMIKKTPPPTILRIMGYSSAEELLEREDIFEIYAALRFLEDGEWMNSVFLKNYSDLSLADFEEREIKVLVLGEKWMKAAEKFMTKKYHNISHLKELGLIFILPMKIGTRGETTRLFTLLLHYLNEVPFYSVLIERFAADADFVPRLMSLLRGDVLAGPLPQEGKMNWRIVQRYLAKDNPNDFRLFEPHVNPEAEHWYRAEADFSELTKDAAHGFMMGFWQGLDHVGSYFKNKNGKDTLVSFDLIDLSMSLVMGGEVKYLYHQQEALWNQIFIEYMGRYGLNEMISRNIIKGYISL